MATPPTIPKLNLPNALNAEEKLQKTSFLEKTSPLKNGIDSESPSWPPSSSITITAIGALEQANRDLDGYGVSRNEARTACWLKIAAEKGNVEAMRRLGDCYEYGRGVSENVAEAFRWYTKALELGDKESKEKLEGIKHYFMKRAGLFSYNKI